MMNSKDRRRQRETIRTAGIGTGLFRGMICAQLRMVALMDLAFVREGVRGGDEGCVAVNGDEGTDEDEEYSENAEPGEKTVLPSSASFAASKVTWMGDR